MPSEFKQTPFRNIQQVKLNSTPVSFAIAPPRVDRERLMIFGVVAMQANVEALGHGFMSDQTTLVQAAELSNAVSAGLRGRFGHPGMSEQAAGKKIMRSFNFRVEGDKLKHDIKLFEPANSSPTLSAGVLEYVMDMAEQYPEEIAESYVLKCDLVWTFPDGKEIAPHEYVGEYADPSEDDAVDEDGYRRPKDALTPLPVMRVTDVYYLDLVNEGALTHQGLFSVAQMFEGTSQAYAQEAFELLDQLRSEYDIPIDQLERKGKLFIDKYVHARSGKKNGDDDMAGLFGGARKQQLPGKPTTTKMAAAVGAPAVDEELISGLTADGALEVGDAEVEATASDPAVTLYIDTGAEPVSGGLDALEQEVEEVALQAEGKAEAEEDQALLAVQVEELQLPEDPRIAVLQAQVAQLSRIVERLSGAVKQNTADIRRIDGEPVVSGPANGYAAQLRHNGHTALGAQGARALPPPVRVLGQAPVSVQDRAQQAQGPINDGTGALGASNNRRSHMK
jgi:hypothetical protein